MNHSVYHGCSITINLTKFCLTLVHDSLTHLRRIIRGGPYWRINGVWEKFSLIVTSVGNFGSQIDTVPWYTYLQTASFAYCKSVNPHSGFSLRVAQYAYCVCTCRLPYVRTHQVHICTQSSVDLQFTHSAQVGLQLVEVLTKLTRQWTVIPDFLPFVSTAGIRTT